MDICGMEKLSLVDFDGHLCCVVFTGGCNFFCPFCHNSPLVVGNFRSHRINETEVLNYLSKRNKLLDSVCVSGGEPTLQRDLDVFCKKIKDMNYLVKLDTNGSDPVALKKLIDEKLIDYIAMDIKNSPESYNKSVGKQSFDIAPISESIKLIMESGIDYEFRTTLVRELFTDTDIAAMGVWLNGAKRLFLQKFKDSGTVMRANLHEVCKTKALEYKEVLSKSVAAVSLRGY